MNHRFHRLGGSTALLLIGACSPSGPESSSVAPVGAAPAGADRVLPKELGPHVAAPFTTVPRNAAVVLRVDRLVAASAVDATTVRVTTGSRGESPFAARVFADPNHGTWTDADGAEELASTRVIVDFAVSEYEALEHGLSLPIDATGLPAAEHASGANVAVRVTWPDSPTSTVRAFRSGRATDPYRGFLPDDEPPRLLSARAVEVGDVVQHGPGELNVRVRDAGTGQVTLPRFGGHRT